jgi:hypothetical protein
MKKAFVPIVVLISVLLWGCPYQSDVALSDATFKIDKRMLGTWVAENDVAKEKVGYYIIAMADSFHYSIDHVQYNENEDSYSTISYTGHLSKLDDLTFLNLQENGQRPFLMYKVIIRDGKFTKVEVTDNIDEAFTDQKKMQEFFKKNMHLSFFYNKDEEVLVLKP